MSSVSVIIPLYNRADLIRETLDSLSTDLHKGCTLEIIVVDDGSTDGGDLIVEKYYPHVRLIRQANSGAPAARNNGLKNAIGKYVLYLDSDDLIESNFFEDKVNHLQSHQDIAGVYGPWEHFKVEDNGVKVILPRHTPYPIEKEKCWQPIMERLLRGWYIVSHAVLWRRETLIQINGHDTTLPINQDVDLVFRILLNGNLLIGLNSPKALVREHSDVNRVGSSTKNNTKVKAIYDLRATFRNSMKEKNILHKEFRIALAEYCFNNWIFYRKSFPNEAEQFYNLSQSLNSSLRLKGGWVIRTISLLLGPRKTVLLKELFSK